MPGGPELQLSLVGAQDKLPMLLVERYDPGIGADCRVIRLHQEDLCQALGVPVERKYEAEGGPSLTEVFGLVTRVRAADRWSPVAICCAGSCSTS